ncbi:hypothetical protein ACFC1T_09430 [Kitasatospora sp. NPDC056076]|uniref:hypothetical protein n=1 Tax=Kitasatospora sp. NPDC056076 TaxID=3345703 RepID=UPI0035DAE9B7
MKKVPSVLAEISPLPGERNDSPATPADPATVLVPDWIDPDSAAWILHDQARRGLLALDLSGGLLLVPTQDLP